MPLAQVGTWIGAGPLPTSIIVAAAIVAGSIWLGLAAIGVVIVRRLPFLGRVSYILGFLIFIAPWLAYAMGFPPINSAVELSSQLILWSPVYAMLLVVPLVAWFVGLSPRRRNETDRQ